MIDPQSPVALLCAEGMAHQTKGETAEAAELFMRAWDQSSTDYERCIAAHYVAINKSAPAENLEWNMTALTYADKVGDESVAEFYPSLLLCVGKGHEDLGDLESAKDFYHRANEKAVVLTDGPYADIIRGGIQSALQRLL